MRGLQIRDQAKGVKFMPTTNHASDSLTGNPLLAIIDIMVEFCDNNPSSRRHCCRVSELPGNKHRPRELHPVEGSVQ